MSYYVKEVHQTNEAIQHDVDLQDTLESQEKVEVRGQIEIDEDIAIHDETEVIGDKAEVDTSTTGDDTDDEIVNGDGTESEIAARDEDEEETATYESDSETVNSDDAEVDKPNWSMKKQIREVDGESFLVKIFTLAPEYEGEVFTNTALAQELHDINMKDILDEEIPDNLTDESSDTSKAEPVTSGEVGDEIAASDHTEDETVCSDGAEDETSASEESEAEPARSDTIEDSDFDEDKMVDDHDTGVKTLSSDAEDETEIVGSDMTEPETGNSDDTGDEISASDDVEVETSSENTEAETSISDESEVENASNDDSDTETVISDAPEDKVPDNLPEEPRNEGDTESGILEGIGNSLDVTEDKVELLENTEQEQALHAMDGQESTETETASSKTTEIILPPGVTEEPRNDEEMDIGLLNNQSACDVYLQVSDDRGELLGDLVLEKYTRDFIERYTTLPDEEIKDPEKELNSAVKLAILYTLQINQTDSRCIGTITKYRIQQGRMFNIIKKLVKLNSGPVWIVWFKENFDGREFRTVQDYMRLANILGIIRYAVFGKERLLEIVRQLTEADKKTDDPVGSFIKRKNVDFNPEEEIDVEELKVQTDIAINHEKCLHEGLEIPIEKIEILVRGGGEVESSHIKALKSVKNAGDSIEEGFDEILSSGKLEPIMTPDRKAEGFKKSTDRFIKAIDSAIEDADYRGQLNVQLVITLRSKLQRLEELIQGNIETPTDDPNNDADPCL